MNEFPNDNIEIDLSFFIDKRYFVRIFIRKALIRKCLKVFLYEL